jgi:predicted transcriptional regulator
MIAPVPTAAQIRAARQLLGWKQTDLAAASGLRLIVIKNVERGALDDPRVSIITAIENAFDKAGVVFLDTGQNRGEGPGVRFKGPPPA